MKGYNPDGGVHVLLGWRCKGKRQGEDCGQFHPAKYLGEKKQIEDKPISLHARGKSFAIPCPECDERHWYHPEEMSYVELDAPPPPGFRSLI